MKFPSTAKRAYPPLRSIEVKFPPTPLHTMRRASPEYIVTVVSPSIVSEPAGFRVTTTSPSSLALRMMTPQSSPRVSSASKVCVIVAVMSMSLPLSATPRIVFVGRVSYTRSGKPSANELRKADWAMPYRTPNAKTGHKVPDGGSGMRVRGSGIADSISVMLACT